VSHLRRINTPISRDSKIYKPMCQLHNTFWDMLCPAEIPEGAAVGLIKNLALMAHISIGSQPYQIIECLKKWSMENLEEIVPNCIINSTKIFVNVCWVDIHNNLDGLTTTLRKLRRNMDVVASEVSIIHDISEHELRIYIVESVSLCS